MTFHLCPAAVAAAGLFALLFCRIRSDGIDGKIYRAICESGPRLLHAGLRRVGGERFTRRVEACGDWVLNKPNNLMQGFYMLIVNGSFVCFLIEVCEAFIYLFIYLVI